MGFCKRHWHNRRYKSIGSCKPWDPVPLFKGKVLLILLFVIERYHFEWWQPSITESRKQPMWNLVSSVTRARTVPWNQWRRGRGEERRARQSVLGCVTSKSRGFPLSTAMTRQWAGLSGEDTICRTAAWVSGGAERCRGTWTPGSWRKVLYLEHWTRAWEKWMSLEVFHLEEKKKEWSWKEHFVKSYVGQIV